MFSYWCLLGETEDRKFFWCYLEFTWNQSDCMIYPHMQLAVVPNLFEPPHSSGWKIVMITRVGAAQMSCLLNICVKACPFPIHTFSPTSVSTAQHDPPAVSFFLHTSPPRLTPVLNLLFLSSFAALCSEPSPWIHQTAALQLILKPRGKLYRLSRSHSALDVNMDSHKLNMFLD